MLYLPIVAGVTGSVLNANGDYTHYLIYVLSVLLVFEFIAFLLAEKISDTLSWKSFLTETLKKVLLVALISISYILDGMLQTESVIVNSTLIFYIGNEMMYIIGLAVKAGVPIPDIIVKVVEDKKKEKQNESDP